MLLYIPHSSDKTNLGFGNFGNSSTFTSHIVQIKRSITNRTRLISIPLHPT